jgi:hypothetical protein
MTTWYPNTSSSVPSQSKDVSARLALSEMSGSSVENIDGRVLTGIGGPGAVRLGLTTPANISTRMSAIPAADRTCTTATNTSVPTPPLCTFIVTRTVNPNGLMSMAPTSEVGRCSRGQRLNLSRAAACAIPNSTGVPSQTQLLFTYDNAPYRLNSARVPFMDKNAIPAAIHPGV